VKVVHAPLSMTHHMSPVIHYSLLCWHFVLELQPPSPLLEQDIVSQLRQIGAQFESWTEPAKVLSFISHGRFLCVIDLSTFCAGGFRGMEGVVYRSRFGAGIMGDCHCHQAWTRFVEITTL